MIKYIALFLILLLASYSGVAQDFKAGGYHNYEEGERTYIVAEKANIRDKPSTKEGAIIDVLYIGKRIEILEKMAETYTSNRITANWYKVNFGYHEGYIWGGLIAAGCLEQEEPSERLLLYGLNHCDLHYGDEPSYYTGNLALKLVVDGELVSQVNFEIEDINGGHELKYLSRDSILFTAKEFAQNGKEAVFKNEYVFSFQEEKLKFIEEKTHLAPLPKQNGLIPLEYPEYLRFHNIKRYREIALWENQKRTSRPSADYEERTIEVGKKKGYVIENMKFDVQGNLIEDYHYLAEGPLVYEYEYRYLKNPSYQYRIDSIFDKTGLDQTEVCNFIYKQNGGILDRVEMYTIYKQEPTKKQNVRMLSIEEYRKRDSPEGELIYLGTQLRIRRASYSCYEYFYENNLLKKEIVFYKNCQKKSKEISYQYDSKGLLIGSKVFYPETNRFTEYVYLYDFYPSDE
jgi:hypothetical protein